MRCARLSAVALTVLLGGCIPQVPEVPEDRFYRLGEPTVPADLTAPRFERTVIVARPVTDGLHTERAILYAEADEPLRILRHNYDLWADSPPVLIQAHLVDFLRRAGVAERVVRSESAVQRGLLIEPRLERFERILGSDGGAVVVALEFMVRDDREPLIAGYQVRRPVRDDGVYAAVEAFEAALVEIYSRLLRDLAAR